MLQNKKKLVQIGIICVLFIVLTVYVEATEHSVDENNRVIRASPGERGQSLELQLEAEDFFDGYHYKVEIPAQVVTQAEAEQYFEKARQEIDERFFEQGDCAEHVSHAVRMENRYVDRMVSAEWTFDSYQYIDIDGKLRENNLKDNAIVQATVLLTCGTYEQEYVFSFMIVPPEFTKEEQLLNDIESAVTAEGNRQGETYFQLPQKVDGVSLKWEEPKQHLLVKVLFFEIVIVVLLYFVEQEKKKTKEKERQDQMHLDYAEFVNKLLILLGSGMSLKQSLNRISARYFDKRQKNQTKERYLYEELLITNHEIEDGESERLAYQKFGERIGLNCYNRLIRILIQNLRTGSRGICELLGQEATVALEERKALARKLGEEAGTKMLLPLIMMLGIVIAIIMVPAMQSFAI